MASDMDFNGADTPGRRLRPDPGQHAGQGLPDRSAPAAPGPEGWLTQSKTSTALYLNTEAVVLEGPYRAASHLHAHRLSRERRGRARRGHLRQPRARA